ncbi:hypothetical protein SB717_34335, partial [Priestia sp. SIMBA_032]|uniref:hypothetical protein n=1 Tax=Priestia sp. SIMBA_032 TaxID=3085775 RepID=UPI00397C36DF
KAPQFAVPVDRSITGRIPTRLLPRALQPAEVFTGALRLGVVQSALRGTVGRLGIPPEVLAHVSFPAVYSSARTMEALAGSGIAVPQLDSYASELWAYWEQFLDDSIVSDR